MVVFPAYTQVRGVYPLGMSATNSGVTPESGFCYVNQFIFYSRDELIGPHGEVLATGQNSVMMDMNNVVWVSKGKIDFLGGPFFSMSATIPIANNSLTSDIEGGISGGVAFRRSACAWERASERADERGAEGGRAGAGARAERKGH